MDLPDKPIIEASLANVVSTTRSTCLHNVGMVEHVLAALRGMEVDNCHIEVDGPEIPVLDGSALPFCDKIETIEQEEEERWYIRLDRHSKDLKIIVSVDFTDWSKGVLGTSHAFLNSIKHFKQEIAPARTFALQEEIEELRRVGILNGVSPLNTIIFDSQGKLAKPQLRFENEVARHKLLDVIGDLALLGKPLKGSLCFDKPGHTVNVAWAKKLIAMTTNNNNNNNNNSSLLS